MRDGRGSASHLTQRKAYSIHTKFVSSNRPYSIFFGGKRQVLSARDREALVERWGDKLQKVEEEAFHLFSSLDRYARRSKKGRTDGRTDDGWTVGH